MVFNSVPLQLDYQHFDYSLFFAAPDAVLFFLSTSWSWPGWSMSSLYRAASRSAECCFCVERQSSLCSYTRGVGGISSIGGAMDGNGTGMWAVSDTTAVIEGERQGQAAWTWTVTGALTDLSSMHCCFKTDTGTASFSKGLCCCSFEFYNKLNWNKLTLFFEGRGSLSVGEVVSGTAADFWNLWNSISPVPSSCWRWMAGSWVLEVGEGTLAGYKGRTWALLLFLSLQEDF